MIRTLKSALLPVLAMAVVASAADILVDDFTSSSESRNKWLSELPAEMMSITVGGGSCSINNTSTYSGAYGHTFSGTKPSTFTITYTVKSSPANGGGVLFCRQPETFDGYFINTTATDVYVMRFGSTNQNVFQKSGHFASQDNQITVSKQGSNFDVSVNGVLVGKFTDATYSSGDVALFLNGTAQVVYGAFKMTDQFTPGVNRTSFTDDFSCSSIWWTRLEDEATVNVADGVLNVVTGASESFWMHTELPLDNGSLTRVEVSHKAGSPTGSYGLILTGAGNPTPMVYFGIRGDRRWYVAKPGESYAPALNAAIKGQADGNNYFIDTLEIRKEAGSQNYVFTVNGINLKEYTGVDFEITGVGLFADPSLTLQYDNFLVDVTSPIRNNLRVQRSPVVNSRIIGSFDLLGRRSTPITTQGVSVRRTSGVYLNEQGKNIMIRGRKN